MRDLGGHRFYNNKPSRRLGYPCCQWRVPDTPAAQDIDTNSEEVDAFVLDTDNTFIDGIDPRAMTMFDL
jgi:hypothetical protein